MRAVCLAAVSLCLLSPLAVRADTVKTTKVVVFRPYVADGALDPSLQVTQRGAGDCWTSSLTTSRPDGWRCSVKNYLYDPCFSRSVTAKQVVCPLDVAKRNVLVYMVYSDKLVEGSPKNSTSTVAIVPWGGDSAPKCGDFISG